MRLVIALCVICVGAALAGTIVTGLFWLTLTALAGLLVTGAVGVSMARPPAEDDAPPVPKHRLRVIAAQHTARQGAEDQDGGELSRAA
jgi:predicted anti-sigma-YlaC factor YlaD